MFNSGKINADENQKVIKTKEKAREFQQFSVHSLDQNLTKTFDNFIDQ